MTAQQISEQQAREIIAAVGIPTVQSEDLGGASVSELLSVRLSELAELYAGWRFDEAQNTDLAVARAALDVEKKASKLLASIGTFGEEGLTLRQELGLGSMYSFALLEGGDDARSNLEQAARGVEKLARWAGETRARAEADMKRKSARFGSSEVPRLDPDDRLLWLLAKTFYEFWKRQPGYSTPDGERGSWTRSGPFIRFLVKCMPMFGIELSAEGCQKRWWRLLEREKEAG